MDTNTDKTIKIKINPGDTNLILASQIIDSISYIPLESKSESMIGEVTKMEVFNELFFILDRITKSIVVFKNDGTFVRRITSNNDDRLVNIWDFAVNKMNGDLLVFDNYKNSLIVYDSAGSFKTAESMPRHVYKVARFGSTTYYYKNYPPTLTHAIEVRKNGKQLANYLEYDSQVTKNSELMACEQYFYTSNNSYGLFSRPYSYLLFKTDTTGILTPQFELILPESYQIPPNFIHSDRNDKLEYFVEELKNGTRVQPANKGKVWNCTQVFGSTSGVMAFTLSSMENLKSGFLYNLKNNMYYSTKNILSDSSVNSLPIIENGLIALDNDFFFSALSPKLLLFAKQNITNFKYYKHNEKLSQYLGQVSTFSNPVITQIKFKQF